MAPLATLEHSFGSVTAHALAYAALPLLVRA